MGELLPVITKSGDRRRIVLPYFNARAVRTAELRIAGMSARKIAEDTGLHIERVKQLEQQGKRSLAFGALCVLSSMRPDRQEPDPNSPEEFWRNERFPTHG